jgi:hypothetical protein
LFDSEIANLISILTVAFISLAKYKIVVEALEPVVKMMESIR